VEDETLACGTGAVAAALAFGWRGTASPVAVRTRSGARLQIHFRREGDAFFDIELEGDARVVYAGTLHKEASRW
jgi:diaminopimelate epimerase